MTKIVASQAHTMEQCQCKVTRDPLTGVQIRIGVMGSAGGRVSPIMARSCRRLGRAISENGCCLLTGACPGMPHLTVLGAKNAGGHIVGISPAASLKDHVETFHSPYKEYDALIFTGMGLMGREIINIYSSDIVVVVGGRSGTLGEFAIAYEYGKLIGVLEGSGGISGTLKKIEANLKKGTGAQIIYEKDPVRLVKRLLERYRSVRYICPCHPKRLTSQKRRRFEGDASNTFS